MSQKLITLITCDLCEEETDATETVKFGLDQHEYTIDLCGGHTKDLRETVGSYTEYAKRVSSRKPAKRVRTKVQASSEVPERPIATPTEVRQWADDNGYVVSARGRIPGKVMEAFWNANAA